MAWEPAVETPAEENIEQNIEQNVERCLRCDAEMEWRHQTWQCTTCGLKIGCCEGATAECA